MSIWGRVHNAVEAQVMPQVVADGVISESVTAMILKARAKNVYGPMGDDIEATWQTEIARGRSYRGAPEQGAVIDTGEPVSSRFLWSWFEADIVIRGSEINQATGLTTKQILSDQEPENVPDRDMMRVYNIGQQAVMGAKLRTKMQYSKALWESYLSDDRPSFAPKGLPTLFDETADWGGLSPSGLGSFNDEKIHNPWGSEGPPNTQTGDAHNYRNVPQVFALTGTPTISEAELHPINLQMGSSIPGYWISPLHHADFATLSATTQANDLVPINIGFGMWRKSIKMIMYDRVLYYVDNEATRGEAKCIHIGEMSPSEDATMGAGFTLYQWVPPNVEEIMGNMPPPNPAVEGYNLGWNTMLPVWIDEYDRAQGQTDSIYTHLRTAFGFVGSNRWKNYVIRGFSTA